MHRLRVSVLPALRRAAPRLWLWLWLCLAIGLAGPARAEIEVDVALVIAVDVSYSMDPEEQALQRSGFAEAFRSPVVQDAIQRGLNGRIAVAYLEWAGASDQSVLVPWRVIEAPDSAMAFADLLTNLPTRRASRTSISGALDAASLLLEESGFAATRRVIDVSGDGPNNQGRPVTVARDEALGKGIVVNGLPIMLKQPGYFDIADLDLYYRDCVIGGPGSFLVPARERAQFRDAIKTKIILEVAGGKPLVIPAQMQAEEPRSDCLSGERQWHERMGN